MRLGSVSTVDAIIDIATRCLSHWVELADRGKMVGQRSVSSWNFRNQISIGIGCVNFLRHLLDNILLFALGRDCVIGGNIELVWIRLCRVDELGRIDRGRCQRHLLRLMAMFLLVSRLRLKLLIVAGLFHECRVRLKFQD